MEWGITHVTDRMCTRSVGPALFHRVNTWPWRRWYSADLLSFWQACFSRAAESPFHTCQAVFCFRGIPSTFPLLFQQHGSNPVWDIYATHHPPLNTPSPAGPPWQGMGAEEVGGHSVTNVLFIFYGIASRNSS